MKKRLGFLFSIILSATAAFADTTSVPPPPPAATATAPAAQPAASGDLQKMMEETARKILEQKSANPTAAAGHAVPVTQADKIQTMLHLLLVIVFGILLGAAGQGVRFITQWKRANDVTNTGGKAWDYVDGGRLTVDLIVGSVAGTLAALAMHTAGNDVIETSSLLGLLAAGYMGADFVDGFARKYMPGQTPAEKPPAAPAAPAGTDPNLDQRAAEDADPNFDAKAQG